jgi:outer membrane biosynthesis protein TonB
VLFPYARPSNRKFWIAVVVSVGLHSLIALVTPKEPPRIAPGPVANAPLNVQIVQADTPPAVTPPSPVEQAAPPPPTPRPLPPQRRPTPNAARPTPIPVPTPVAPVPTPIPQPVPIPAPQVDMMAAVEARRAARRAREAAEARGPPSEGKPTEDAASRNLATLSGREGVGGVFQILRIGTRTAEFAFNGWRPESRNKWREVIEVDAGQGGNVELAIVKRMITLIRTHYTGNFQWESHRLGRVVPLSARPEDSEGLEDFMMKEFFGQPVVNPRR